MIPVDPHVVGFDLSLTRTGIASSLGWAESFPSKPEEKATWSQRADRIAQLLDRIGAGVGRLHVDLAVLEGPAHRQGAAAGTWDRAGLWWSVALMLQDRGIPFAVVPPSNRAQYATGHQRGDKDTVLRMMRVALPAWDLTNDDEADAAALAAMGRDWLGRRLFEVDRPRWEALDGCAWPVDDPGDLFAFSGQ